MDNYIYLLLSLVSLLILSCEGNADKREPKLRELSRSGRKYDTYYKPPVNFADDSGDMDDSGDDDTSDMPVPPSGGKNPDYGNFKGFDYKPNYPQFFKGYLPKPYWKGSQKDKGNSDDADDSDRPPLNPAKMMEMMMMMNAMKTLQDSAKDESKGLFPSLSSQTKQLIMVSIIPLSIMLAAVVPVLVNYMMTGATAQLISTTASTKDGRSADETNILDTILQNFEEIARYVDSEECLQKALCQVASRNSSSFGEHIKKVASTVAGFVKTDWVKDVRIKNLVSGLQNGNCENVCKSSLPIPRNRNYE